MTAIRPSSTGVGVMGTALAHGTLVAIALLAARGSKPVSNVVYEVNLVAAPLPSAAPRSAAPQATPTAPEELAPTVKPPPAKPVPARPPRPADVKRVDQTPITRTAATPAPGEAPSTGQDAVTLHQAGIIFPYPEYLRNVENRIFAHWNHAMFRPGLAVNVVFVILRDGSVDPASIQVERGSGNYSFDLNARAAVEAANAGREFGPLPTGWNGASLPLRFDFTQVAKGPP